MVLRKLLCFCLFSSIVYAGSDCYDKLTLTGINIIDRNGLSETICSKEKLKKFSKIDFLQPHPYQKVMRLYKNPRGDQVACLTTYHPNGQLRQYLECLNNRAYGRYREWHSNGKLKIQAEVINGIADLHPSAESSWLFNGETRAYNDDGKLEAIIYYDKGQLEGVARYFHANGIVWKECPYQKGVAHGEFRTFMENGDLLKTQHFQNGKLHGLSIRYALETQEELSKEEYVHGKLTKGYYLEPTTRKLFSQVEQGQGLQAIYDKHCIIETRTILWGESEGVVTYFGHQGQVLQTYTLVKGMKEGEELLFYDSGTPKLLLTWSQGVLQGSVKTWYPNGNLESCREMVCNKKSGLLTLYYPEGQIMATEEYDQELLIKGEYFRLGDRYPYTKVERGCGTATLFSSYGVLLKRITYQEGKPIIS